MLAAHICGSLQWQTDSASLAWYLGILVLLFNKARGFRVRASGSWWLTRNVLAAQQSQWLTVLAAQQSQWLIVLAAYSVNHLQLEVGSH